MAAQRPAPPLPVAKGLTYRSGLIRGLLKMLPKLSVYGIGLSRLGVRELRDLRDSSLLPPREGGSR